MEEENNKEKFALCQTPDPRGKQAKLNSKLLIYKLSY